MDDIIFFSASKTLLNKLNRQLMDPFEMSDTSDMSRILDMNVIRRREKGAITISQKDYTEEGGSTELQYGRLQLRLHPRNRAEPIPEPPEEKLLNKEEKWCYRTIIGAMMYLAQVTLYDILYAVNQLARAMSKPAKAHMGAAKHCLRYLARSTDFSITYKQGGFRHACFLDAN